MVLQCDPALRKAAESREGGELAGGQPVSEVGAVAVAADDQPAVQPVFDKWAIHHQARPIPLTDRFGCVLDRCVKIGQAGGLLHRRLTVSVVQYLVFETRLPAAVRDGVVDMI